MFKHKKFLTNLLDVIIALTTLGMAYVALLYFLEALLENEILEIRLILLLAIIIVVFWVYFFTYGFARNEELRNVLRNIIKNAIEEERKKIQGKKETRKK